MKKNYCIKHCTFFLGEYIIYVAKTKVLISCVVAVQLVFTFVFAFAKSRLSLDVAHIIIRNSLY